MIGKRSEQLEKLYADHIRRSEPSPSTNGHRHHQDLTLSDEKVIELCRRARNAPKFERLYDFGDTGEYGGDDSRADQALISVMAFFTQESEQLDRLFRGSALCREKWTARLDYRRRTIDKALRGLGET